MTQLAIENLAPVAAGGVVTQVCKSAKFVEALEELGQTAKSLGAEQKEKYRKLISGLADELGQQVVTDTGHKIKMGPLEDGVENTAAKMVGRFGESLPERKPLFLIAGANKLLNDSAIQTFGGMAKLEAMTEGELASIGLRRYELPKLKMSSDGFSIQAHAASDRLLWARATVPSPGSVVITDINIGALPKGSGNQLLTKFLEAHNAIPREKLIFRQIMEPTTVQQLQDGIEPAQTVMGKLGIKSMKALGVTPKSCTVEIVEGQIVMTISTK
ncbi:hypothetical protein BH11CYA1_BH11CYA1_41250 [soil metagenome]